MYNLGLEKVQNSCLQIIFFILPGQLWPKYIYITITNNLNVIVFIKNKIVCKISFIVREISKYCLQVWISFIQLKMLFLFINKHMEYKNNHKIWVPVEVGQCDLFQE